MILLRLLGYVALAIFLAGMIAGGLLAFLAAKLAGAPGPIRAAVSNAVSEATRKIWQAPTPRVSVTPTGPVTYTVKSCGPFQVYAAHEETTH